MGEGDGRGGRGFLVWSANLFCIQQLDVAPFCENYGKLHFYEKYLSFAVLFLANIGHCPNFLD